MRGRWLQAVLFDLDNTLVDRDAAFARWLDRRGVEPSARGPLQAADRRCGPDRGAFVRWLERNAPPLVASPGELAAEIAECVEAAPWAAAVLAALSGRCRLALVTNGGSRPQRRKLARAGLEPYFGGAVLVSAELGAAKPEPAIFEAALALVDCRPDQALFVGDDPERDIAGAAALGMATCWLDRRSAREGDSLESRPTFTIAHLGELLAVLGPHLPPLR